MFKCSYWQRLLLPSPRYLWQSRHDNNSRNWAWLCSITGLISRALNCAGHTNMKRSQRMPTAGWFKTPEKRHRFRYIKMKAGAHEAQFAFIVTNSVKEIHNNLYRGELSYSLFGAGDYTESEWRLFGKEIPQFRHIFLPSCLSICDAICLVIGTRLHMGRNSSWKTRNQPTRMNTSMISVLYQILDSSPNEFTKSKRARVALFLNCHCSKISNLSMMDLNSRFFNNGLAGWRRWNRPSWSLLVHCLPTCH